MELITLTPEGQRCYHEVILPSAPQKPRFDLDISSESVPSGIELAEYSERVKDHVITVMLQILTEMGYETSLERDLSVYSSHRRDKRSYHLIFHHYCHSSTTEALALYQMVIERTEASYHHLIDRGIYNRYGSLRLLWCHKREEPSRPKRWNISYRYRGARYHTKLPMPAKDEEHLNIMALSLSLVTFTSGCVFLPPLMVEKPVQYQIQDLHPLEVEQLHQMIMKFDSMLELVSTRGTLLQLKRNGSSYCPLCLRVHHAENPYGWVNNGEVYYNCRRASHGTKYLIGILSPPVIQANEAPSEGEVKNNEIQHSLTPSVASERVPISPNLLYSLVHRDVAIPHTEASSEIPICEVKPLSTIAQMERHQMKYHGKSKASRFEPEILKDEEVQEKNVRLNSGEIDTGGIQVTGRKRTPAKSKLQRKRGRNVDSES